MRVYQQINPVYGAARSDLFRYLLMYAEGGVYLDIKSSVTRPFDELISLDDRFILSQWNQAGWGVHPEFKSIIDSEYQQWHIITVKGHLFLRGVIERVLNNIQQYNILKFGIGRKGVFRLTGPIPYTLAIVKSETSSLCRKVDISKDFGIIYSIYSEVNDQKAHRKLFKKHYSKIKTPIVIQSDLRSKALMCFFYSILILKYLMRKFLKILAATH